MKLILDKNFIQETKEYTKEHEKAVKFNGWTADGEEIELVDMESNKIAPIVRYLAEGKKKKLGWLLILWAGLLLFIFFAIMLFVLWPKDKVKLEPVNEIITPVIQTVPVVEIKKIETETETEKETSWSLEMANEVDMFEDMKNEAEIQTLKLSYEVERFKIQLEDIQKDNEKLTKLVNNLEQENIILSTRKSEGATDNFIYYLWDEIYKKCKQPTTEGIIKNCKTLYFNFLEYDKNR